MTTTLKKRPADFVTEVTNESPGYNLPQKMGRRLWAPMLAMALMAFPVGFILAIVRANEVSQGTDPETIAVLGHLVPAFMFVGFIGVFSAITFAITRILGAFRKGGGDVQQATGVEVKTIQMPASAKVMMGGMMMGMMVILISVILHVVAAASIGSGDLAALESSEQWAIWLEGFRRFGVALYLFGIAFGLATIITVLRFQAIRIRQIAAERA